MLPPLKMLATKKQLRLWVVTLTATSAVLFVSCGPPGPRALLKGERLIREGKYEAAVAKLEEATRFLPREAQAWNHLGLAYHGAGRSADAIRAYQQAVALDRNLAAAQYNLGCLHLERADLSAALRALTTFTGLQPQSDSGWFKLGMAYLRAGQSDAAERCLQHALQINQRLPAAWNGLGLLHIQRRRYAEAHRQFEAAVRVQPEYAPALLNSAIVAHQFLNDRAGGLERYRRYLALDPRPANWEEVQRIARQLDAELRPPAHPLEAGAARQIASAPKPAESGATSEKREPRAEPRPSGSKPASAAAPTTARSRSDLTTPASKAPSPAPTRPKPIAAEVREEEPHVQSRPTDAIARVESPSRSSDDPARAAGNGREPSAAPKPPGITSQTSAPVSVTRPAIVPPSTVPRYRYQSPGTLKGGDRILAERSVAEGLRLQERYQVKEAIEKYREAIRADPASFDAYYNLGVAAFDSGDLPQALLAYEYALAVDGSSKKARFNFAVALERAGYPWDAAQELERLLAEHPDETRAQFSLAHLYADKLGEPQRAKSAYSRVLELDPQHPQATAIRYWLEANP